ncbi:ATP-binding protein [Rheinheimera gaetbuli]
MTRIFLGLLITCLVSLFGLGYLLDRLADQPTPATTAPLAAKLLHYLAQQSQHLNEAELIEYYRQQAMQLDIELQLEHFQALAIPTELMPLLSSASGLALAGDQQQYLLRQLTAHPQWLLKMTLQNTDEHHPLSIWLTLALYLGMAFLLLLWQWPLVSRLKQLTRAAERFGRGEHSSRLSLSRFSYIPGLEQSFNRMADQISQLLHENQLLAKSLSHDLRTPIACLRFGLDALFDVSSTDKKQQLLQRMEQDVDRMEAMVNSFLQFASLSRTALSLEFSRQHMQPWLQHYCQSIEPLLAQQQLRFSLLMTEPALHSQINPHWLERALSNIISNACRFASSQIQITLSVKQQQLLITISDDGPGIAITEEKNVLLPFVKLDTTIEDSSPHFGLGLAITAEIIKWHHGSIVVDRDPALAGARFSLYLKLCS